MSAGLELRVRVEHRVGVEGRVERRVRVEGRVEHRVRVEGRVERRVRVEGRVERTIRVCVQGSVDPNRTLQRESHTCNAMLIVLGS